MQYTLELVVLLVAMVFAWRRTAARHLQQGRGNVAAQIGGLGAAITVFAVVAGLILVFDPPSGLVGKTAQPVPAASAPTTEAEPSQGR